jgi:hypothetical protein
MLPYGEVCVAGAVELSRLVDIHRRLFGGAVRDLFGVLRDRWIVHYSGDKLHFRSAAFVLYVRSESMPGRGLLQCAHGNVPNSLCGDLSPRYSVHWSQYDVYHGRLMPVTSVL